MKASLGILFLVAGAVYAQPSIVPGGVLNAASFGKNSSGQGLPVAPGSLVAIFGSNLGASQADADTVPFSTSLGGVTVSFNGVAAPMRDVVPAAGIVNVQIPFEAMPSGQTSANVTMTVSVGSQSASQQVSLVPSSPGVFTLPSGAGTAVLVNLSDGTIAAPGPNLPAPFSALKSSPISRGTNAFFYATGLGAMTPPVTDGDAGGSVEHDVNVKPVVFVGGVSSGCTAPIIFAGQAPGFPGVYQVNITIPQCAPTGDNIDLQVQSADGTITSPTVAKISVR